MEAAIRIGAAIFLLGIGASISPQLGVVFGKIFAFVLWFGLAGLIGFLSYIGLRWQMRRRQEPPLVGRVFGSDLEELSPPPLPPRAVLPVMAPAEPAEPPAKIAPPVADRLREIDWFQFEKLVGALYGLRGFTVIRRGGAHPDGGVDLVAEKDGERTVVQCKHWQSQLVKPDKVRELIGAQSIEKAHRACLVTMRGYTDAARSLAQTQGVELVEETQLLVWLAEARFTPAWPSIQCALDSTDKACPRCESPLVQRVSAKGANLGRSFWGCSTYPRCNFTFAS